jgi:glycosyltransferase involved in cell wall biosynthesis
MEKITFCIPSKSNLRYLKTCLPSIRKNAYRKDHDIIIFVDSDEDGTVEWLETVKEKYNLIYCVNPNLGKKLFGIGKAYDYCIEHSTTDIFMIFHADMMLGINADLNAFKHLKSKTVVCSTRVEPPIHPNAGEKILQHFGMWPEEFKSKEFDEFVELQLKNDQVTEGIFAPWMMYKEEFLSIGGHDPRLHSAREDSDVFNRLLLSGFEFKQPWNSLVYHLTGRGGQFQHGKVTQDETQKSDEWRQLMNNSTKEFIRKWKSTVKHTPLMKPIVSPIYNTGIQIVNGNQNLLEALEPWGHSIYIDLDYSNYIDKEQLNTEDNLILKLYPIGEKPKNDIVIRIDGKTFTQQDFLYLQEMGNIISKSGEIGKFKVGNLVIEINKISEIQSNLMFGKL